jgi:hypothetical protein
MFTTRLLTYNLLQRDSHLLDHSDRLLNRRFIRGITKTLRDSIKRSPHMISFSIASDELFGGENSYLSFYKGVFIIAPLSLDIGNNLYSFKTVTGTWHSDRNMCRPDGATKHAHNMFLTHGRLQSRSDEIVDEPFYSLLFMTHFDLVNIGIS